MSKLANALLAIGAVIIFSGTSHAASPQLDAAEVDIAGVRLGMTVEEVKVRHPSVQISVEPTKFRNVDGEFVRGEVSLANDGIETLVIVFSDPKVPSPKVLKLRYTSRFGDDGGGHLGETAILIDEAKKQILAKYGEPRSTVDEDLNTRMDFAVTRADSFIRDEVTLKAEISRWFVGDYRLKGNLTLQLSDEAGLLRQQVTWVQDDMRRRAQGKSKKLSF